MGKVGVLIVVAIVLCTSSVRAGCPSLGNRINVPGVGLTQYFEGSGDISSDCNYDLEGVKALYFDNGNLNIFSSSFYGLDSVRDIIFSETTSVTVHETASFSYMQHLNSVSFRGSVRVFAGMFSGCPYLYDIRLPSSFVYQNPFEVGSLCSHDEGCEGLEHIYIDNDLNGVGDSFKVVDGVLLDWSGVDLIQYPSSNKGTSYQALVESYTIPDSVKTIMRDAFRYSKLKSVTIPGTVNDVRMQAFAGSSNLQEVTYLGTENPSDYGGVFDECDRLDYVCVPSNYEDEEFLGKPVKDCGAASSTSSQVSNSCGDCYTWTFDKSSETLSVTEEKGCTLPYPSIERCNTPDELVDEIKYLNIYFINPDESQRCTIQLRTFANLYKLEQVDVYGPNSCIYDIYEEAFEFLNYLKSFTVHNGSGISCRAESAFEFCDELKYICVPKGSFVYGCGKEGVDCSFSSQFSQSVSSSPQPSNPESGNPQFSSSSWVAPSFAVLLLAGLFALFCY